jgi:hypothetical protein
MRRIDDLFAAWPFTANATSTGKLFDFSTARIFDSVM